MNVTEIYEQRCQDETIDIVGHMPRLFQEAAIGDASVIELGVRTGNSTSAFLAAVEQHGGHVWSVDIVQPDVPFADHQQWTLTVADDREVAAQLPDDVDVLFIDSSHFYGHTLRELTLYVPKVRRGGVVLMHDTELDRSLPKDPRFPVKAAIERYFRRRPQRPTYVPGWCGLGVIRL